MGLIHMKQNKELCPQCYQWVWTLLFNGKQDVCISCHPTYDSPERRKAKAKIQDQYERGLISAEQRDFMMGDC